MTKSRITPGRFCDQTALVVGGAQGIGKAIAARLAQEGAQVVVADIDEVMMSRTAVEITRGGGMIRTLRCDVTSSRQVTRMVARVIAWYRRIDILMYVAGVAKAMPFVKTEEDDWDHIQNVNLTGAFRAARAVVPHMIRQKRGKLVFMSSTN